MFKSCAYRKRIQQHKVVLAQQLLLRIECIAELNANAFFIFDTCQEDQPLNGFSIQLSFTGKVHVTLNVQFTFRWLELSIIISVHHILLVHLVTLHWLPACNIRNRSISLVLARMNTIKNYEQILLKYILSFQWENKLSLFFMYVFLIYA